ncbi:hypothetical protein WG904_09230 [Pedobacter sp. Du54]|uniref:hypothetical protein n=1 Tax=Pedobacter anseongensis TaxID=3133439 RepID=UPI0030983CAC
MRLSEHKELKVEILALPQKEKDKLLLRLVAKDKVLTEHLHFLLLEDETNLNERIDKLKEEIITTDKDLANAKDVLMNLRKSIKSINHFLKVTKANYEEVELRIFLLNHTKTEFKSRVFSSFKNYEHLFAIFFVKSVLVTLKKFEKLHVDLQFDLKEDLNKLLSKTFNKNMAAIANDLGLPKQR